MLRYPGSMRWPVKAALSWTASGVNRWALTRAPEFLDEVLVVAVDDIAA